MIAITGNTYPVKDQLKAMGGKWDSVQKAWMVPDDVAEQAQKLVPAAKPPMQKTNVGDLSGIIAMFDKARAHLKFPAIVMSVPKAQMTVRINVAGDGARYPGSLNVADGKKPDFPGDKRTWYGRVHKDGNYEPTSNSNPEIAERLAEFARDPLKIAAEHGRLTGRCCFCNRHLQDERSTAVGYGPTCAEHYGLAWGVAQLTLI